MAKKKFIMAIPLLASLALAWQPAPGLETAGQVVDAAYSRIPEIATSTTVDLGVKDGQFVAGSSIKAFNSDGACLSNWFNYPQAFEQFGSRPVALSAAGQADVMSLEAQRTRNAFKNLSAQDALALAQKSLPSGHLRVYLEMQGLARADLRAAYTLGIAGPGNGFIFPYRSAFLDDWAPMASNPQRFGGTMVYYFDLTKAGLDPKGVVNMVLKTEANSDCAYSVAVDLGKFE
jgi:hypothetical protein